MNLKILGLLRACNRLQKVGERAVEGERRTEANLNLRGEEKVSETASSSSSSTAVPTDGDTAGQEKQSDLDSYENLQADFQKLKADCKTMKQVRTRCANAHINFIDTLRRIRGNRIPEDIRNFHIQLIKSEYNALLMEKETLKRIPIERGLRDMTARVDRVLRHAPAHDEATDALFGLHVAIEELRLRAFLERELSNTSMQTSEDDAINVEDEKEVAEEGSVICGLGEKSLDNVNDAVERVEDSGSESSFELIE